MCFIDGCLSTDYLNATRYMKVKKMGIRDHPFKTSANFHKFLTPPPLRHADVLNGWSLTEILRRIWLFFANKIKFYESVSKQPTQLIIAAHKCHKNIVPNNHV